VEGGEANVSIGVTINLPLSPTLHLVPAHW
jgi:hypothetical protein